MLKILSPRAFHRFLPRVTDADDKSIWQRLGRNVSIGIFGSGVNVGVRLGQTLLLTRFLKIDDYGRILIVLNIFVFFDSFFGLRVSDVMFRFFQPLKEQGDEQGLKRLLIWCLGISLASGLLIYLGVLALSPWLAARLYSTPGLSPLLNIYGLTILISAFSGVYEPILRMYDRFAAVVVPQVLGQLITLAILSTYFATANTDNYDLRLIVAAFALGMIVQSVVPFVKALSLVRPFANVTGGADLTTRLPRQELVRCLINSNLSGYLKFAINPGDMFLLGLFSSPTQVALFGLAKQMTSPLALLQTTMQTAITPEITNMIAKLKLGQLQRLIFRYVASALVLGGLIFLAVLIFGRFLILHFFAAQYLAALPAFYCLAVAAWLLLIFVVFRPLAVSLDLLRWHNLALLMSAVIVICLIVAGRLEALTMAYVQLAEASILRLFFSLLVWQRLHERSKRIDRPTA
jgi:O-antigen/teichoic acid export membrane protein